MLRVTTRLNVGGPARQAIFLTDALRARGYDTRLVWGASGPAEGTIDPPADLPHTYLPWLGRDLRPADDLRAARAISGIVRRWRPDVVHTHLAKAGALGRAAAVQAGVPVVVHTFHGHVLQSYFSRMKNAAFARVERALAARTDALIAVAPQVRDELLALGIGTPERWHVVPVGLDLEAFVDGRVETAEARDRLGLPSDVPVVGVVGRLTDVKDHATFLRAAAHVARVHPDAVFVIAGDGPLRADLEADARAILGDRVRFTGWVNDLPALYAACDVIALTSRNEGTPLGLIEAGAAGRPVVATRVGGVAEVVRDGVTGDLVAAGDHRAVGAAVAALLAEPARAAAYGEAATAHVRARYARDRLLDDLAELYGALLARRSAAPGVGIRSSEISRTSQATLTTAPTPTTTA